MDELLSRIGLRVPLIQAGMGGGLAGADLAVAVTAAGGLGTLGMASASVLSRALEDARRRTDGPVAINLLLPFIRAAHSRPAAEADVVVTFWGKPRRLSDKAWMHQVGSVDEARQAHAAGADAVIVQGVEAGGHVRGRTPALQLLEQTRSALPSGYPILLAGGIADADDVATALASGAVGAVCGTRFLMSEESGASEGYKARLAQGSDTLLTELFGLGWPGAHRVLPNSSTSRWLRGDPRGPVSVRAFNRATGTVMARGPERTQAWLAMHQRVGIPIYAPVPASAGMPDRVLETSPLYAGETVARIQRIETAKFIVDTLTVGFS